MKHKICFATRNQNKLKEISQKLGNSFEILSLDDINCQEELPETTETIEGNSAQKAQYVWDNFNVNCFADDSGLEVDALEGAPGVNAAFYAGTRNFEDNMDLLLKNLEKKTDRKANFKTVITLILEGKQIQFTGIAKGEILTEKRGKGGFGYDPLFVPQGFQKTFAEMTLEEKNQISHRAKATIKLIEYLKNNN